MEREQFYHEACLRAMQGLLAASGLIKNPCEYVATASRHYATELTEQVFSPGEDIPYMKQTAVEWLRSKMLIECLEPSDELFEQAKAMEKEQIKKAFEEGMFHHSNGLCPDEYYNETFKSE